MTEVSDISFTAPDGTEPDDTRRAFSQVSYRISKAYETLTQTYLRLDELESVAYVGGLQKIEGINQVSVLVGPGLVVDTEGPLIGELRVSIAPGLVINPEGQVSPSLGSPIILNGSNQITLRTTGLLIHPGIDAVGGGFLALDGVSMSWKLLAGNPIPRMTPIADPTWFGSYWRVPNDPLTRSANPTNEELRSYLFQTDSCVMLLVEKVTQLLDSLRSVGLLELDI